MKRKVASKKLKRTCNICNCSFRKGSVYYVDRKVYNFFGIIEAYENTICPKCKYKEESSSIRYRKLIESKSCTHPISDTVWQTIAGEDYAQEPSHTECLVCRKVL